MIRSPPANANPDVMLAIDPNPADYPAQLANKRAVLTELLKPFAAPALAVFPSPTLHYRQRAEFKLWHEQGTCHFAVFPNGKAGGPVMVEEFPVASATINEAMARLLAALRNSDVLRRKLFQVEFLSTTQNDLLITLVYHKSLTTEWELAARELERGLSAKVMGRSRGQRLVVSSDYVEESFTVGGRNYHYRQVEGYFSQPNGAVCGHMLNWVAECAQGIGGDFLELYCGNGNFTLPLAAQFTKGLATEVAKPLVEVARINAKHNAVGNINFVRLSAEETSQALRGVRPFRRLRDIDLATFDFSTAFVDPPRAGLDDVTLSVVRGFERILYVSCNPHTLADNLRQFDASHRIERAALFDQFPYTDHIECGVALRRR